MSIKVLPATAMRSNGAEYARTYHHLVVTPDVTIEDILRPRFWAHHVQSLNVNDLIDVVSSDGGLDVQLRVTGKGIGFVETRPRLAWIRDSAPKSEGGDAGETLPDMPDGYTVNFAPKQGWRVMMNDPHQIVSKDHKSKREAIEAATAHARRALAGV